MKNAILGFFVFALIALGGIPVHAQNVPKGWVDQVVLEEGTWRVKGWACEPNLGHPIGVVVYAGDALVGYGAWPTSEYAEPAIHHVCGTDPTLNHLYGFSVPIGASPIGQSISVYGVGSQVTIPLTQSGQLGLPWTNQHPETSILSANKVLVYTAHPDDETSFAPILGKYCSTKICKIVVATRGGGPGAECLLSPAQCGPYIFNEGYKNIKDIRATEMQIAANNIPANLEQGDLSAGALATVQSVKNRWATELAAVGASFDTIIQNEIDTFHPDIILTFDPRHGTTCHEEHRAIGSAVLNGVKNYSGFNFNKNNLLILTSKYTVTSLGTGFTPAVPTDRSSVVYSAKDFLPTKGKSGWAYLLENMTYHPSQFSPAYISSGSTAEDLDRTISLQRAISVDFSEADPRYNFCPNG